MMSVYVDPLIDYGWKLGPSCHLISDDLDELHEFAQKIGMKRSWFQNDNQSLPHYDLTGNKRRQAIKNGAIELTREEMGQRVMNYINNKAN
jgi:hypothetical protein